MAYFNVQVENVQSRASETKNPLSQQTWPINKSFRLIIGAIGCKVRLLTLLIVTIYVYKMQNKVNIESINQIKYHMRCLPFLLQPKITYHSSLSSPPCPDAHNFFIHLLLASQHKPVVWLKSSQNTIVTINNLYWSFQLWHDFRYP